MTIISETGFPHSAAFLEYPDGTSKWLGFVPKIHKAPISDGKIDTGARDKNIDKYIRLEVDAKALADAEKKIMDKYADKKYEGTICDCVTFTADLCEAAGLQIPKRPNLIPGHLVNHLKEKNPDAHPVIGTGAQFNSGKATGKPADDRIVGVWRGSVKQPGESDYSVKMTITSPTAGTTDYPEIKCGGNLSGRANGRNGYVFEEKITYGRATDTMGGGIDGTITVELVDDKTLTWSWKGTWQGKEYTASATLKKE